MAVSEQDVVRSQGLQRVLINNICVSRNAGLRRHTTSSSPIARASKVSTATCCAPRDPSTTEATVVMTNSKAVELSKDLRRRLRDQRWRIAGAAAISWLRWAFRSCNEAVGSKRSTLCLLRSIVSPDMRTFPRVWCISECESSWMNGRRGPWATQGLGKR